MKLINGNLKQIIALSLLIGCATLLVKCTESKSEKSGEMTKEEQIARGIYLTTIGSCNDCHTPKVFNANGMQLDSTRIFSGHREGSTLPDLTMDVTKPGNWMVFSSELTAAAGPWGMSFSANLTPDETTGIGAWTEEVFIKTLRTGKHLGMDNGRQILPPMPWYFINKMTDEDLKSVYAYLRSLPPVKNQVPSPIPPGELVKKMAKQ